MTQDELRVIEGHVHRGAIFTPKTYGLGGTTMQGFNLDDMITPGVNVDAIMGFTNIRETGESPTLKVLIFNLRRSLLAFILGLVAYYKLLPTFFKQMVGARAGALDVHEFEAAVKNAYPKLPSLDKLGNGPVPNHIAIVLRYYPRVAPPPPLPLDPETKELVKQHKLADTEHDVTEQARLVNEISDLVVWCIAAHVSQLTVYEKTGFVTNLDKAKIHQLAKEKLAMTAYRGASTFAIDEVISNGLSVVLVEEASVQAAVVATTEDISTAHTEELISIEEITTEFVNELIMQAFCGTTPSLLILLGSTACSEGFPLTANTTIYRDFTHNQSTDLKLFCRALKSYSSSAT